jgi:predicted nucleic acid-binding Zn finger protein
LKHDENDAPNEQQTGGFVKCAIFSPSGRKLWTVVGTEYEYWTDPEIPFCSCADFYFSTLRTGRECYHIQTIRAALEGKTEYETLRFSDDQYSDFICAIAQDAEVFLRD